jgi:hypothetical protein
VAGFADGGLAAGDQGEVLGGTVKGAKGLVDALRSVEELFGRRREKSNF